MRLLTAESVEAHGTQHPKSQWFHTIQALAQALADSPCPVCMRGSGTNSGLTHMPPGFLYQHPRYIPCPHCGDFPDDRKGKAFRDWREACDNLAAKEINQ